jgi:hypothetical protein
MQGTLQNRRLVPSAYHFRWFVWHFFPSENGADGPQKNELNA